MSVGAKIDPAWLPPELAEPIASLVEELLQAPRFERRLRIFGMDFNVRVARTDRRISVAELERLYARFTTLAMAAADACRQQAVELQAQQERDLTQARTDFLAAMTVEERGLFASQLAARAEADARVVREYDRILRKNDALTERVKSLEAEVEQHKVDLQCLTDLRADLVRAQKREADLHRRISSLIHRVYEAQTARGDLSAEYEAVRADLEKLDAENEELGEEAGRWHAQARGEARAAARFRKQRDAVKRELAAVLATNDELERTNAWLLQKLRFRGGAANAA